MINRSEILQTIAMIDQQHLDIRTITMGISLLDCADTDIARSCTKVYDKICRLAGRLVRTGEDIEAEFGIPIVPSRSSRRARARSPTCRMRRRSTAPRMRSASTSSAAFPRSCKRA